MRNTLRPMLLVALAMLICLPCCPLLAQDATPQKYAKEKEPKGPPKKGDIYFSPVPVFGANPAFGFIYGVGAATSWFMGDPASTHLSTAMAGVAYTTNKQLVITMKTTAYTANDNWILMGDWRYLDSSQPTYGLGTGPQSAKLVSNGFEYNDDAYSAPLETAQMLSFKFLRFHETVLKKVRDNTYIGLGYHLDLYNDMVDGPLELDSVPPVISSYYAYNQNYGFAQDQSTLSGLSLNAIYDKRDNQNNPYTGPYAFVSLRYNPEFLGSDKDASTLWLEYRHYLDFHPENHHDILAFWTYAHLNTSGTLPYMDLPALGWDIFAKSGRGYVQGRFRGQNLWYGEVEYRKHLFGTKKNPEMFGGVAFLNATTASNKDNDIGLFQYVDPAYGLGLRIMMSKQARTNICIDYALGNYGSSGFYMRLNETF